VTLDLVKERGIPLDDQSLSWKEMVGRPYSKLDVDAFTRVRVILMNGIESEQLRFLHVAASCASRWRGSGGSSSNSRRW